MKHIFPRGAQWTIPVLFAWLIAHGAAYAQERWPTVPLPPESIAFPVDDVVITNGVPMKLSAFSSPATPEKLRAWYHKQMQAPLVENRFGQKIVLGQARGEHYVTIQLEQVPSGTRGIISVSNLKTAYEQQAQTQAARREWIQKLPPGSRILAETSSENASQRSQQIIFANRQGVAANRDSLKAALRDEGLVYERETGIEDASRQHAGGLPEEARTLYFKGRTGEAMATITDDRGETVIVLNTTQAQGKPQ